VPFINVRCNNFGYSYIGAILFNFITIEGYKNNSSWALDGRLYWTKK